MKLLKTCKEKKKFTSNDAREQNSGFKNTAEIGTTRPSRIHLETDRTESDTIYDTIVDSVYNQENYRNPELTRSDR